MKLCDAKNISSVLATDLSQLTLRMEGSNVASSRSMSLWRLGQIFKTYLQNMIRKTTLKSPRKNDATIFGLSLSSQHGNIHARKNVNSQTGWQYAPIQTIDSKMLSILIEIDMNVWVEGHNWPHSIPTVHILDKPQRNILVSTKPARLHPIWLKFRAKCHERSVLWPNLRT